MDNKNIRWPSLCHPLRKKKRNPSSSSVAKIIQWSLHIQWRVEFPQSYWWSFKKRSAVCYKDSTVSCPHVSTCQESRCFYLLQVFLFYRFVFQCTSAALHATWSVSEQKLSVAGVQWCDYQCKTAWVKNKRGRKAALKETTYPFTYVSVVRFKCVRTSFTSAATRWNNKMFDWGLVGWMDNSRSLTVFL